MMGLIVVSNRVTVSGSGHPAPGGLAVALTEALRRIGGAWVGWSGEISPAGAAEVRNLEGDGISYLLVDLTEQEYEEYYTGFANRSLWPLMHYRVGLTEFSPGDFAGYKRVNAGFARHLMSIAAPDDLIWVHDYHLMPLAHEVRLAGGRQRMGYFHHIPWPPPEVFTILPAAGELLRAMTDYDVIGLQTATDRDHFCQCLVRELGLAEASDGSFRAGGRALRVIDVPIGIDAAGYAAEAAAAHDNEVVRETMESIGDRALMLGVDRLDYSKGVAQRMEAYAHFIETNPHRRATTEYLQITPLSRSDIPEYEQINQMVAETAGRINGAIGEPSWTPIRYVNRPYDREVLAGLYRLSRVCLVTPMRDGMNLVAKEFVAAQDPADPGVLVLSRFAGAVRQLSAGAIVVNPYDRGGMAAAMERALSLPLDERRTRWERMVANVREFDVAWWVETYLDALRRPA
ncbi:MAG: alpha,alpha-trehalose-phosphate synthase (UDP-forming) [Beijerinckiaceae bacterium]